MDPKDFTHQPLKLAQLLWPSVSFYKEQRMIIQSVVENDETFVPAANAMGKDFVAAFLVLWFFLTRHPCRIVTTSAKDDHLRVLWGEIGNFINTSTIPLSSDEGGPLILRHQDIGKMYQDERCPLSYVKGMVASADSIAAMQGHHIAKTGDNIPRTLFVSDESSSVPDTYWTMARTWFNRALVIGNTWPCNNFFKRAIKGSPDASDPGGNLLTPDDQRYYRRVIQIKASQSPNVRYAQAEISRGITPSNRMVVPGVKPYDDYVKHRKLWDKIQQCVSLDAEFYEGAEVLMFPPEWLNRANTLAERIQGRKRVARGIGIDPAEGGDRTAMAASDEYGLIELVSKKTPNTSIILNDTLAFARKHGVYDHPDKWCFDRGGGGKQLADMLESLGHEGIKTVGFGEGVLLQPKRGLRHFEEKVEQKASHYAYKNRRAQLYGLLRLLLDPSINEIKGLWKYIVGEDAYSGKPLSNIPQDLQGYSIPQEYTELRRQLAPIPLTYDSEGRLELLPKHRREIQSVTTISTKQKTLMDLIGCSPDEADAVCLSVYAMCYRAFQATAGAI